MGINVTAKMDLSQLEALEPGRLRGAIKRAIRKAGSTALRDMRSEASKRVRARLPIKPSYIHKALTMRKEEGHDISEMSWSLVVSGEPVPLVAYPHRQTKKGVSAEVHRGRRVVIAGSFIATMKSGHKGVFKRIGSARLPIRELLGSRPVDALLNDGEADAVAERGHKSLRETFERVLLLEIGKK